MKTYIHVSLSAFILNTCWAYNILLLFPFPTKSHSNLGDGFVRHLLKAGHKVTYITTSPWDNPPTNLQQVDVNDNYKILEQQKESSLNVEKILNKQNSLDVEMLLLLCQDVATATLETPAVQELMKNPREKFDVVIAEWMFTELFSGLGIIFDCPLIWSSSLDSHWMLREMMDGTTNPAYTADYASTNIPPFTFKQRLEELWLQVKVSTILRLKIFPKTKKQYNKIFGTAAKIIGRDLPEYEDARLSGALMFLNSHVSFGAPNSVPHNFKYIGGYHIETPVKPLPENLKKIMDEAKHGVIYFSMGSVLKSRDMPEQLKTGLLNMFAKLKQIVIWKFEELLPNTPQNVHIVQWAPQPSILNHSNCVLFITHGGLLSTTEAIHLSVPVIGVPMFADQFNNMQRAEALGIGKRVDMSYDLADQLYDAINDILTDDRFKTKMKYISSLYHDRQHTPGEELVYWVEHVIRTKGALHLISPARTVFWYEKLYLDLISIVVVMVGCIWVFIKRFLLVDVDKRKKE